MRSGLALAGAATAAAVLLSIGHAHTSGAAVPPGRVGYHRIVINGAPLLSIAHTTTPDGMTITGSDMVLIGNFKFSTVQERFGAGVLVTCQFVSQSGQRTQFSCTGLSQSVLASSTLTILVT